VGGLTGCVLVGGEGGWGGFYLGGGVFCVGLLFSVWGGGVGGGGFGFFLLGFIDIESGGPAQRKRISPRPP